MNFTCSVEIDLPREKAVSLWKEPENLKYWQDGFQRAEHISGRAGEPGAKYRLYYFMGKREMILTETTLENRLPETYTGLYEGKDMTNTMKSTFLELDNDRTRWDAVVEYHSFHGLTPRLLAFFMPGVFRRQVLIWMDQFKMFAEQTG